MDTTVLIRKPECARAGFACSLATVVTHLTIFHLGLYSPEQAEIPADAAHVRGLSIGLKNDLEQAAALQPSFDWAMNEECFDGSECGALQPFVRAGKAVFVAEYDLDVASFCPQAQAAGFMAMRKRLALAAWRQACW